MARTEWIVEEIDISFLDFGKNMMQLRNAGVEIRLMITNAMVKKMTASERQDWLNYEVSKLW